MVGTVTTTTISVYRGLNHIGQDMSLLCYGFGLMSSATTAETQLAPWLAALHATYDRLGDLMDGSSAVPVDAQSFASDWSVAQVFSHLGSQADVFGRLVNAGLRGETAPGPDAFPPIWAEWDAKTPRAQVADALTATALWLDQLESLDDRERLEWRLSAFGMDLDLPGLARLRLGELALHTWDINVVADPGATLVDAAVPLLVDWLPDLVARAGKPGPEHPRVHVHTRAPLREFLLTVTDTVELVPVEGDATEGTLSRLDLPAETFVRLVYGRLRPDAIEPIRTTDLDLEVVRRVFPGV
jgi:uncharacterized protein (TIGR03083 family)